MPEIGGGRSPDPAIDGKASPTRSGPPSAAPTPWPRPKVGHDAALLLDEMRRHNGGRYEEVTIVGKGPSAERAFWRVLPAMRIGLNEAGPAFLCFVCLIVDVPVLVAELQRNRGLGIGRGLVTLEECAEQLGLGSAMVLSRHDPRWRAGFLHAGSGGLAVAIAARLGARRVHLAGFDAYFEPGHVVAAPYGARMAALAAPRRAGGDYSAESEGIRLALEATGIEAVRAVELPQRPLDAPQLPK